jgi:hypothetical protein
MVESVPPGGGDLKSKAEGFSGDRRFGFTESEPLSSFALRFVEPDYWIALVASVREIFGEVAHQPSEIGLVVADDPLLGLAATALFERPEIHVPTSDSRRRRPERLAEAVDIHPRLRDFVRDCGSLPDRESPLLMLTWSTPHLLGGQEKRLVDIRGTGALRGGLVCLCNRRDNIHAAGADAVVRVDLSELAASVVAGAIRRLDLPSRLNLSQPGEAEKLLTKLTGRGFPLERVINSLNTPSHGDFLGFVQQLESSDRPRVTKVFEECVLATHEDRPRHAASLFLVSHFSRLSPRQFLELGDALCLVTPVGQPPRDGATAPQRLTDQVLRDCSIAFTPAPKGDSFASVVFRAGPDDDDMSSGPERTQHLRLQFETRAPLLSERYLRHLGDNLVLGHPSWNVARDYIRHEARALRAAAESDEQVSLTDRLRRAVYGNEPVGDRSISGDVDAAKDTAHRVELFVQALDRVPALLEEFVGPSLDDRLVGAVRALCSADPSRSSFVPQEISRLGSVWLFWCLYAQYPGKVTLRDFPSFFQRNAADGARRKDALRVLHGIFSPEEDDTDHRELERFGRPDLLVLLITDIVRHRDRLVEDAPETCRSSLLAETWISYLRNNLRGAAWNQVVGWQAVCRPLDELALATGGLPSDLELAKLLTLKTSYGTVDQWVLGSRYRGRDSDDEAELAANHVHDNARALFELAPLLMDAVVGCAAFEDLENTALEIWLLLAMNLQDEAWAQLNFGDKRLWLPYALGSPVDAEDAVQVSFRKAMDAVFAMFPVIALMAATHVVPDSSDASSTFVFSSALHEWLGEIPRHSNASPARELLDRVQLCFEFQKTWKQAHDHIRLNDVDWRAIAELMADRTAALNAFASALEPIARASRPGALPSRSKTKVTSSPAATSTSPTPPSAGLPGKP